MEKLNMKNEIVNWINSILQLLGINNEAAHHMDQWVTLLFIVLLAMLADFTCRIILLKVIKKIVMKTKVTWDDIIFDEKVMARFCHIVAPVLIYVLLPIAFPEESTVLYAMLVKIATIYIIMVVMRFINAFAKAVFLVYDEKEEFNDRPLKGLLQTAYVVNFFIGIVLIVSVIIDKSPATLFAGLGASAAVLVLVFKDGIMGFISGIQLSANNMLRPGDWITMPKYNADGTVIEVTLNTVKVRNFDNTITTIPPYALVSDSFQNWRGMRESGGRRVKRSINIDMNSIQFCTPEMIQQFSKIELLKGYLAETEEKLRSHNEKNNVDDSVIVNGLRQTNLGVFRAYLENYLRSLPEVNQEMQLMVRQLQSTDTGLPLELYFFSHTKEWIDFEKVQADVFDHVLAVVPEFHLSVFQSPTGADFKSLK